MNWTMSLSATVENFGDCYKKKLVLENDDNFVTYYIFIEKFFPHVAVA